MNKTLEQRASKAGKIVRSITTPTSIEGMVEKVKDNKEISKYLTDDKVKNKIDEIVEKNYAKYESVLDKKLPTAAQAAGTAGTLGADLLYVLSGGIGSYVKLYTVGARAAAELPSMLKIAYNEGIYNGTVDTVKWLAKKAASFFLPFVGSAVDVGSVKNYARDAIVRESKKEVLQYLKKEYLEETQAEAIAEDAERQKKILPMALQRQQLDRMKEVARMADREFYSAATSGQDYKIAA